MKNTKDISGEVFGRLTAVSVSPDTRAGAYWNCVCLCGNTAVVRGSTLRNGMTQSCGCLLQESRITNPTKHGMYGTPTYVSWENMKGRCNSKTHQSKKYYRDAGITYDVAWSNFESFFADMGVRPDGTTLDRIDNTKGYYKENCRWATAKQQSRNVRTNVFLTDGEKTLCQKDWATILGVSDTCIRHRRQKKSPLVFSDIRLEEV